MHNTLTLHGANPYHAFGLKMLDMEKRTHVFLRDRLKHKSPNSAHGESAFSGVLGVRLGGGTFYGGTFEPREYINPEGRDARPEDIISAWRVLDESCSLFVILVILFTCIIH